MIGESLLPVGRGDEMEAGEILFAQRRQGSLRIAVERDAIMPFFDEQLGTRWILSGTYWPQGNAT
jgi:hypothetical protein